MGRKLGSKNKVKRAKARSAYDTYSYWYDKYTKGEKAGWFRPKLNKQEFDKMYDSAKKAGVKNNRARTIAASQEYVDRKFEKKYKELYGKEMGDLRDPKDRERLFLDFKDELVAQGMSYDDARKEFERYFY